eukprot:scaffold7863_cov118-Isochrysis_galbana.AAC.3
MRPLASTRPLVHSHPRCAISGCEDHPPGGARAEPLPTLLHNAIGAGADRAQIDIPDTGETAH